MTADNCRPELANEESSKSKVSPLSNAPRVANLFPKRLATATSLEEIRLGRKKASESLVTKAYLPACRLRAPADTEMSLDALTTLPYEAPEA